MNRRVFAFRVRPHHHSRLYAEVHVYRTKEDFDAATETTGLGGLVCPFDIIDFSKKVPGKKTVGRMQPQFADVYLQQEHLGVGVVSHEMFHLALAYMRRVKIQLGDDCDKAEERIAWVCGNFNRQATLAFMRHKLYKEQ